MKQQAREDILARLRTAEVRLAAPTAAGQPEFEEREVYSDYGECESDLLGYFCEQLRRLRGEPRIVGSPAEAAEALLQLAGNSTEPGGGEPMLVQDAPLLRSVMDAADPAERDRFKLCSPPVFGLPNNEAGVFRVGVTTCEMLVARTGGIALRARSTGVRLLSVLPEYHIVVAESSQLVAGLDPWYRKLKEDAGWNFSSVITGPSRTSDIEKILVLGAHGPKRLSVIIIR